MASFRLYFRTAATPSISPAFAAGWDDTEDAVRRVASLTKAGSAESASQNLDEANSSNTYDVLGRQYIYEIPSDIRFEGTVQGLFRGSQSTSTADWRAQCVIRLIDSDGSTVNATLYDFDTGGLSEEWPITTDGAAARWFPRGSGTPVSLTPADASAGDYLVIEIGIRSHNTSILNRFGTLHIRNGTATDLSDYGDTDSDNSWMDFDLIDPATGYTFASFLGVA